MNSQPLTEFLHAVLRGEAHFTDLVAHVDETIAGAPEQAAAFLAELDALYANNEVRYDIYLHLKDRLARVAGTSTGPLRFATSNTTSPVRDAGATAIRSVTERPEPADRTRMRSPDSSAPHATPSRPSGTPTGGTPTGSQWDDIGDRTVVIEQPLEPGTCVKDRFVLEERLGEGGMGVVFKARDLRKVEAQDRDPYVAIKFLNPEFRRHPESLKALQREARRAQTLAHPNVVTVYDFDRDGTLIFMTMEFLAGEALDVYIQRHPQGLRFRDAWPIIEGAGRALTYTHEKGDIHADFKPSNVFVVEKKAKVLDFGIARAMHARIGGQDGTRFDAGSLGALTPAYASPEMLLNEPPDPRDDVYALACVSYELMTGRHPFKGATAVKAEHDGLKVKRVPGMGRYQYKALLHGLAFRRNDRTRSIEAFLDEIAGPFGVKGRAVRQAVLSTVGTAIIVGIAAAAIFLFTRPDPDKVLARRIQEVAHAQFEESKRGVGQVVELDTETRKVLLEQGNDYLAMAHTTFDPGVLSEGVSNAYGAFQEVLRMDPSNQQAVDGIVAIVGLYETEIQRRLEAGDYAGVVELTAYARRIDPNRASLEEAERDAKALLAPAPVTVE